MSHALTEQKERWIYHIFKEASGAYGSVRKQIESFESGRGAFVTLPTGFCLIWAVYQTFLPIQI